MKALVIIITLLAGMFVNEGVASAQMMGQFWNNNQGSDVETEEERKGREIWQSVQSEATTCQNVSDSDYELMGEYFMGAMMGGSHEQIDAFLEQRYGGEDQMHVVMGKRLSGCDVTAAFPGGFNFGGMMPMIGMMGGFYSVQDEQSSKGNGFNSLNNNPMMWGFANSPMGWGYGAFGWIFMLLFWILIIVGIVALVKWFATQSTAGTDSQARTPLDILKERYAKGEINKEEFESKKKDLSA